MDATSTVEVVGAEGGAGNSGGGGGGGDMVASVTSIMENSKDAMDELFQDEAEVDDMVYRLNLTFANTGGRRTGWWSRPFSFRICSAGFPLICSHSSFIHTQYASLLIFYFLQANAGYEIPARLRTLHNLVIQYASQGRYAEGN